MQQQAVLPIRLPYKTRPAIILRTFQSFYCPLEGIVQFYFPASADAHAIFLFPVRQIFFPVDMTEKEPSLLPLRAHLIYEFLCSMTVPAVHLNITDIGERIQNRTAVVCYTCTVSGQHAGTVGRHGIHKMGNLSCKNDFSAPGCKFFQPFQRCASDGAKRWYQYCFIAHFSHVHRKVCFRTEFRKQGFADIVKVHQSIEQPVRQIYESFVKPVAQRLRLIAGSV